MPYRSREAFDNNTYILGPGEHPPIAPVRGPALPEASYHGIGDVPGAAQKGGRLVLSAIPTEVRRPPLQGPPGSNQFYWQ